MKTVVITGAGAGLGRALAKGFASEGNRVILLGRTGAKVEKVAAEIGGDALAITCDIGSPESVREAFARIEQEASVIDVLINNAGVYEPYFIKDATDEQISAAIQANLAGPIYCCRAAIPLMRKGCQIINVSSETVGLPHAMFALYQSSKAGLERFDEALRAELDPAGIRVTLVRAGQMMGEDSRPPSTDPDLLRVFAEENAKRGLDLRNRPISSFDSAASTIRSLTHLPADLQVPVMYMEGWAGADQT